MCVLCMCTCGSVWTGSGGCLRSVAEKNGNYAAVVSTAGHSVVHS